MKPDEVFGLENAGWPALLVNDAGTIVRANQAAVKLFGPALEGAAPLFSAVWAPENGVAAEHFLAQWERSPAATGTLKFRVRGGGTSTLPVSICSFLRDGQRCFIFQLLPESLDWSAAQKQKLDCALQLARTVSLDFNNALTTILGYTSLILAQMEPENPWRKLLMEVEKSASKAAEIADDLGTFSRQEKETRSQASANVNSILQRSTEIFRAPDPKKISWNLEFERKLFVARVDEAKMQQAFVKILENAVQAIDLNGQITVQTRNVELTQPAHDRDLRLEAGTYVCIEITDNGHGIPPEVLPRVFEPFFTTRRDSGHRGLGLALVYGIVTNHGGGVAISSQAEVGTAVRVYLPAEARVAHDTVFTHKELNGTQTILMVDDEELVLAMGQTILSSYGYQVLTATSGQAALDLLAAQQTRVDLVITDLVMPAMSGREVAEHIRRILPHTPVLCTSGNVRLLNQDEQFAYLRKPFTTQELLAKVKSVLSGNIS